MRAALLVLAALAAVSWAANSRGSPPYIATCYFGSWATYRWSTGKFDVENIDPFLCTHHIYTFAGLDDVTNTMVSLDPYNDLPDNYGKGAFTRFTNMKLKNPDLITILAVGGWTQGSKRYSDMAADPAKRATFVASAVAFVQKFNFDGMDLDWEYPAERGGEPIDKDDYVQLIKELKEAFVEPGLLLTASVGPGKETIDDSYHLAQMAQYLDIFNVMAYDFHGSWEPYTGHVAPLYLSPLDSEHGNAYLSVNFTVNYYIEGGVPRNKIAMGIPLYGHGFVLDDISQHGLYAPAQQPQQACTYTQQAGVCGFNEICELMQSTSGWTSVRDPDQKAVYSYNTGNRNWVGYDDLEAVKLKTDYIKAMGLAGSMVWSIETDDFHDLCGLGTNNPLQTAIWTNLNGDIPTSRVPDPTTPLGPTVRPPTEPQPTSTPSDICKHSGLNPDPDSTCSATFFDCEPSGDGWSVTQETCGPSTVFDEDADSCVWPWQAKGCNQLTAMSGLEA